MSACIVHRFDEDGYCVKCGCDIQPDADPDEQTEPVEYTQAEVMDYMGTDDPQDYIELTALERALITRDAALAEAAILRKQVRVLATAVESALNRLRQLRSTR